jgi:hypothetical protein
MRRSFLPLLVLAVALLLAGCSAGNPVAPAAATPSAAQAEASKTASPTTRALVPAIGGPEEAYPGPDATAEPYPAPELQEAMQATLEALPTLAPLGDPASGKGHLTGQIMRESDIRSREPLAGWTLYLALVHRNVSGEIAPLASVVEATAPTAVTDRDGRFAFADVEPGLYALVIKHPLTLVLARDLQTDQDVVVEITADQVAQEPLIVVTISD